MVLKAEFSHLFKFPFEQVIDAYFKKPTRDGLSVKFPEDYSVLGSRLLPLAVAKCIGNYEGGRDPNVQRIIIEEHWIDDIKKIEYWRRSGQCSNVCPWFLRKFLSDPTVFFTEELTLDRRQHKLFLHTKNITFSNYIILEETSEYRKSECNPKWTQFVQEGVIDAKGLGGLSSFVERLAKSFLVKGGSRSVSIMEELLSCHFAA